CHYSLVDQRFENVVHKILKCCRRIRESKEHNCWFEKSVVRAKSGFPFISFLYTNIVVSPSDIHFRENFSWSKFIDEFTNQREWIVIFDCGVIKLSIILCWSQCSIFLFDKKERRCHWQCRWSYSSSAKVFFNDFFQLSLFFW